MSEAGQYAFDWWVATQSSAPQNGAVFAVSVFGGGAVMGCSPAKTGQVGGFAVIEVSVPPAAVSLTNESAAEFFYAGAVPVKASLFVRAGLENLVDGNAEGTLRGIGAASDYVMGPYAVALGLRSTALGVASHAEGFQATASVVASHAEGQYTAASGEASHAEGAGTIAADLASHAEGLGTNMNNHPGAHIMGQFGQADAEYSWFLANGTDGENPGLAAKILGNGKGHATAWLTGRADYAELFETLDGEPIEPGYFIIFGSGAKIR